MEMKRLEIQLPAELLDRLDQWRQQQAVPPSRAATVRALIEAGLGERDVEGRLVWATKG